MRAQVVMGSLRARFLVGAAGAVVASLLLGFVVGATTGRGTADEGDLLLGVALASMGTLILGGVGVGFDRWVVQPVLRLSEAAKRIGAGDYGHRVDAFGQAELGDLAAALNDLGASLEADHAALAELARTLAAEQAVLAEAAIRDPLTGLYNARELHRRMEAELSRADRAEQPLGCMLIDVDHFKAINDTHGHPAGDAVLRTIAEIIQSSVRPADTVARYGGEEFIVLLPDATDDVAVTVGERVRSAVADARITTPGGQVVQVTVTVGVTTYPRHAIDAHQLITAADQAMYAGKRGGRDRVARSGEAQRQL